MDLRELYQDIILDHGRHPRNFRALGEPSHFAHGHNPLCGDKVTIYLQLEGDRIVDASFNGKGCAISTASASLMTEIVKQKTLAEARSLFRVFHARVTTGETIALAPIRRGSNARRSPGTPSRRLWRAAPSISRSRPSSRDGDRRIGRRDRASLCR
jgi:SUF system NifU family Fe-S assembly protein